MKWARLFKRWIPAPQQPMAPPIITRIPKDPEPEPEPVPEKTFPTLDKPLPKFWTGRKEGHPSMVILHYTATFTAQSTYDILKKRGLSVHYTIARDGTRWHHVDDKNRAIHAGYGVWNGLSNSNHYSLGIEINNIAWVEAEHTDNSWVYAVDDEIDPDPEGRQWYRSETYKDKHGKTKTTKVATKTTCAAAPREHRDAWKNKLWSLYPEDQVLSVCQTVWEWLNEYDILPENVVGHEHVSPHRKSDPGPCFPWDKVDEYLEAKCADERPDLIDPEQQPKARLKALQSHLERCGYPVGAIDGAWGKNTAKSAQMAYDDFNEVYEFAEAGLVVPTSATDPMLRLMARLMRRVPGFDAGNR